MWAGLLPEPNARGTVILVTGWRQVGKTTLLLGMRDAAQQAGLKVGGFLSVARYAVGEKAGIDLEHAATGQRLPLATFTDDPASDAHRPRTGHYVFDPAALDAGREWARAGSGADAFFVDELGPLEFNRGEGWAEVITLIRQQDFGVALVTVRPELLDVAREAFGLGTDAPVVTVTLDNREALRASLSAWIAQLTPR